MLDVEVTGEEFLTGFTHEEIRQRTDDITNNMVFFIGEATTYLGYTDPDDLDPSTSAGEPSLNYHIVDTVEILEPVPINPDSPIADYPDYMHMLTEDVNVCDLVDNQGVDEILIWAYQGFPETRLQISESKMSSEFGDISNSPRLDDMPDCDNTYIVYTYNYAREVTEAIHAWGHQIEAEMSEIDPVLFRDLWQGPNYPATLDVDGRCGSVHNAPNARFEYDSFNPEPHRSDCLDWNPVGVLGALSGISCQNWGCNDISDTDNSGLNYHVWNWQNLPGIDNDKEYQGEQLRNFWDVHGDWDNVMANDRRFTVD